jgi:cytochrome c oxidase assembly protein subunit 15
VALIALWQLLSGLSNVVLGWPLIGAVAHTAGAAAWVTLLAMLLTRARQPSAAPTRRRASVRHLNLPTAPGP